MQPSPRLLSFDDTRIAFEYKTDAQLKKSHLLFKTIQSNFLVKMGPPLVAIALKIGLPIQSLLRKYLFDQFCGGINLEDTLKQSQVLNRFHVRTILDYSVESQKTEEGYEACFQEILNCIRYAQRHTEVSFVAMKVTGIANIGLLEKIQKGEKLDTEEKLQFDKVHARVEGICRLAHELGQSVFIDAEETWIQDVIDQLAEEMMLRFNQTRPVVYTTVQMYRHDRLAYLKKLIEKISHNNVVGGIKLVRGAYLEKETLRAQQLNYPNPMQPSKKHTDDDFNAGALMCLDAIDRIALCLGTHNEESSLLIANEMRKRNIPANHTHVYFSQLYGMSDTISFNLAQQGFNVAKYLPYGPLKLVLPYLFRRAQENTSIAGQSGRELRLIEQELARRKKKT